MWTTTGGLEGRKLRLAITVTSIVGFSLFGYDQGLMSGIISGKQFTQEFPSADIPEGSTKAYSRHVSVVRGAITSCYELGCLGGALLTLIWGEKIGRTRLLFGGGFLIIVGAAISAAAVGPQWGLGQFVIGRVISGIGNGMDTATIPVWQSECSKAHNRGFLVCFEGAIIAVGTFIAYWLDFGLSYVDTSIQWRFPVAFQIVFALVMMIGAAFLPESPRWLLLRGHDKEAAYVLSKLNGASSADDATVVDDINVMKAELQASKDNKSDWKTLFTFGKTQEFQRMMIGCSGQFFQQFTGCNAAIYYSTLLFKQNLNMSDRMALILGGVFSTVYAIFTLPSFFMIERVGRRKLYLIGFLGQGLSFIITMACLINPTPANSNGAAVGIFLFIAFFAFTILPLPWIYPPEINPLRTRTRAAALSTCTNWLANFTVVMFTPVFSDSSGWGIYLFFALINLLAVPFAYFFYPETSGRQLEEIDLIFAKAHVEGKWPFQVAKQMPMLENDQILEMSQQLGLGRPGAGSESASSAVSLEKGVGEGPGPRNGYSEKDNSV
ncbi:sugar transporter-like protein [Lecanicillium sp. MT-2017a]|nr:sugar transporter-like protein [Lecanicillium sp. MT-2017a]